MRTIKRIIKIHKIEGYKVFALFSNGASRVIDFKALFKQWNIGPDDKEYSLLKDVKAFQQVAVIDGTFVWENLPIKSVDENGQAVFYPYDVDPIVMYENSEEDEARKIEIGLMIKQARKELGLTQAELAAKSGTSKHYISRIENNKSGIELATLIKIIEGGLGKRLQISIV